MTKSVERVRSDRRLRDLGFVNWVICRVAARSVHAKHMHLFNVLGQHKRLFWVWLPFSGVLLGMGKLPRRDTELVILRVGHLRGCTYELQHHSRIGKHHGLDNDLQQRIATGPRPKGVTREETLLRIVDELVNDRTLSPTSHKWLAHFYSPAQIIEFCMLVGQYDALATTIAALQIPLDLPE